MVSGWEPSVLCFPLTTTGGGGSEERHDVSTCLHLSFSALHFLIKRKCQIVFFQFHFRPAHLPSANYLTFCGSFSEERWQTCHCFFYQLPTRQNTVCVCLLHTQPLVQPMHSLETNAQQHTLRLLWDAFGRGFLGGSE